ncbi:MAG: 4-phosphopantetheinyl transferase family protein [Flavobacteriaceae bacterium]
MIGNDIIDLAFAEAESNWQRKGFLEKQFTPKEQATILEAENSFITVWTLWSMKEAAYKIWVQQNQERIFAPIKFECEVVSEDEGIVHFQKEKYYTKTKVNTSLIHTIGFLEKTAQVYTSIGSVGEIDKRLKKKLQKETGFPVSEIKQKKTKSGAPNYFYMEKALTKSCSISHHGNYGAFVYEY